MRRTQKEMVLNHLQTEGNITPWEALKNYGCFRLAAVIFKLRREHKIITQDIENINKFGDKVRHAKYLYVGEKTLN